MAGGGVEGRTGPTTIEVGEVEATGVSIRVLLLLPPGAPSGRESPK